MPSRSPGRPSSPSPASPRPEDLVPSSLHLRIQSGSTSSLSSSSTSPGSSPPHRVVHRKSGGQESTHLRSNVQESTVRESGESPRTKPESESDASPHVAMVPRASISTQPASSLRESDEDGAPINQGESVKMSEVCSCGRIVSNQWRVTWRSVEVCGGLSIEVVVIRRADDVWQSGCGQ